ncbi:hypothetical protein ES704_00026 [subsurface metagenome]|jgi:hypothetical protein
MEREKLNNQNNLRQAGKEGYIIVPNYFLREWVKVLGIGPALLYLLLLSYCHKEKDIAWPTLTTLSSKLGISKNSLLSYRKILLKYGLINKIVKRRTTQGNYQSNFYKITSMEGAKIEPRQVHILGEGGANIAPGVVQNLHPNNNNLKHYQGNNNKEGEDDVAAVTNFKKLKKKGEEKMQAIKEQLMDLDFKESFIEKLLKDYSPRKIEEKIDLLLIKRNIQNPAGWLMASLKYDYQSPEQEERVQEEEIEEMGKIRIENKKEASSREKALEMIRKTREMLANLQKKEEMCNGIKRINH